jgi:hypothetical protein
VRFEWLCMNQKMLNYDSSTGLGHGKMAGWNGMSTALFWLTLGGMVLLVGGSCAGSGLVACSGMLAWLSAAILMAVLFVLATIKLDRAWRVIQPLRHMDPAERWMPTPLLAVALLFVPLFNFYWIYVAIGSLPRRMNKFAALTGKAATPVEEDAPRALCRSCFLAFFPVLNLFVVLAWPALVFEAFDDINRTTNELLERPQPTGQIE